MDGRRNRCDFTVRIQRWIDLEKMIATSLRYLSYDGEGKSSPNGRIFAQWGLGIYHTYLEWIVFCFPLDIFPATHGTRIWKRKRNLWRVQGHFWLWRFLNVWQGRRIGVLKVHPEIKDENLSKCQVKTPNPPRLPLPTSRNDQDMLRFFVVLDVLPFWLRNIWDLLMIKK